MKGTYDIRNQPQWCWGRQSVVCNCDEEHPLHACLVPGHGSCYDPYPFASKHWTPQLIALAKKLRPLRDRVIVSRIAYEHPTLSVVGITIEKGLVIAVGPGRRLRRKTRFDGPHGKALWFEDGDETGKIRPVRVHVGQCVEFSPRGMTEFELDHVPLLHVWEQSIYGETNDSASDALLWQKPGGYDRQGNFMSGADLYV